MMSKATPGPWEVDRVLKTMIWTEGEPYGHGRMQIADVRGWGHLTGQGAARFSEEKAAAIQDATATLIAAAPEMYEALKAARIFIRNGIALGFIRMPADTTCDSASLIPAKVDAAIAKAEGK